MAEQQILSPQTALSTRPAPVGAAGDRFGMIQDFIRQPAFVRALPLIGVMSAIGLTALAYFAFRTPAQTPLFSGLVEADKAAVAEALQAAGMAYDIDQASGTLSVDADQVHQARMMLAGQGLPKALPSGDSLIAALPMGSSRAVEGETLRSAREADLARTIEAINSVKSARVHLATAEPSVFVRDNKPAAASVMLTLQQGRALGDAQVQAIRHLVASSVPGLAAEQVSVIDQSGALLSADDAAGTDNRAFQLQMQMEERYRQALIALLSPMIGQGNFSVEVNADVDMSESQATRESYPQDDRVIRSEEGNKTTSTKASEQAMGIPGALSNQPPPASQISTTPAVTQQAPAPNNQGEAAETFSRTFDNGREISVTHNPQGRLNRVSVAVALRQAKGAKALNEAELAKIENLVKGAVGFNTERGDLVAISQRAFVETTEPKVEFWNAPWFRPLVQQGGAILAALLAFLLVGRPIMKAMKARAAAREAANAELETQLLAMTNGDEKALPGGVSPRKVTLEMIEAAPGYEARANLVRAFVRQDSARAAQVVRQLMLENANAN
jgi:flagellar M-ring protein FliF